MTNLQQVDLKAGKHPPVHLRSHVYRGEKLVYVLEPLVKFSNAGGLLPQYIAQIKEVHPLGYVQIGFHVDPLIADILMDAIGGVDRLHLVEGNGEIHPHVLP